MRYLLLDKIITLEPPVRAVGVKCISLADDLFVDHFPGVPIFPGAMLIEAMASTAGLLLEVSAEQGKASEQVAILIGVDQAKFRKQIVPGDRVILEATLLQFSADGGRAQVVATVEQLQVATAVLTFALTRLESERDRQHHRDRRSLWLTGRIQS